MISHKRMEFIKSENGMNYYLFTPSLFSLYYDDGAIKHAVEPKHRYSIKHKLHMIGYIFQFGGGYKILYVEQNQEILSYIIFVKANNRIIKKCESDDYYTIFLWTYPEHREKGLATKMANVMLHELSLNYNHFYKTIGKDNFASVKVAEKSGFTVKCDSVKTKIFRTIHQVEKGEQFLYWFKNKEYRERGANT